MPNIMAGLALGDDDTPVTLPHGKMDGDDVPVDSCGFTIGQFKDDVAASNCPADFHFHYFQTVPGCVHSVHHDCTPEGGDALYGSPSGKPPVVLV